MARTKGALGKKTLQADIQAEVASADKELTYQETKKYPNVRYKVINGIEFIELGDEMYRTYEFPNGRQLQIDNVKYVNISKSGGHRLLTVDGRLYYVKPKESWFMAIENYPYADKAFTF